MWWVEQEKIFVWPDKQNTIASSYHEQDQEKIILLSVMINIKARLWSVCYILLSISEKNINTCFNERQEGLLIMDKGMVMFDLLQDGNRSFVRCDEKNTRLTLSDVMDKTRPGEDSYLTQHQRTFIWHGDSRE